MVEPHLNKHILFRLTGTLVIALLVANITFAQPETHIRKKMEIADGISPKSIVSSGTGIFAAQNMMYRHTITLYNHKGERLARIKDGVNLKKMGFSTYQNATYKGAPVEAVFTSNGKYLWVSNYAMFGAGFENPGCDSCIGTTFDPGFLYKINTTDYSIESVVEVGSVPKFLALSADETRLIASNWVSSDISIIDLETEKEVKRLNVGPHPRGIDITEDGKTAFVTIMGSTKLAEVNLETYAVKYIRNVGKSPRSVLLADHDSTLYVSLNSSNKILKYNRYSTEKMYCKTAAGPRSMTLSPDDDYLYVVNYFDDSFTKIQTDSMLISAVVATSSKPIGICGNWIDSEIWVACYSGKIEIFKDFMLERQRFPRTILELEMSFFDFGLPSVPHTAQRPDTVTERAMTPEPEVSEVNISPKENKNTIPPKKNIIIEKTNNETCDFHIIVGAFSVPGNAQKKKSELIELGYAAQIIHGKLNYVSIQCFDSEDKAEAQKLIIRNNISGCESAWVLEQ